MRRVWEVSRKLARRNIWLIRKLRNILRSCAWRDARVTDSAYRRMVTAKDLALMTREAGIVIWISARSWRLTRIANLIRFSGQRHAVTVGARQVARAREIRFVAVRIMRELRV